MKTVFKTREGNLETIDGISFSISKGETVAIVGESGSGKSVSALSILHLLDRNGEVLDCWYNISDPELDKMLDEQRIILDVEERKKYVYEIQRYVLENLVNPIPQTTYYTRTPRQPYVRDLYPHASYGYGYLKDIWIDK